MNELLLIFSFLTDSENSGKWYLSADGTDSNFCGSKSEDPCATFPTLWRHPTEEEQSFGIQIVSNMDFNITDLTLQPPMNNDKKIEYTYNPTDTNHKQVFVLYVIRIVNANVESPICVTITNTTFEDLRLYFNVSQVSLVVENSTFSRARLVVRSGLRSKPVTIDNTIFSDFESIATSYLSSYEYFGVTCGISVHDNATVNIRNTRFLGNTHGYFTQYLISCYRSNINVMHVTMGNNKVNLMEASGCNLKFTEIIVSNNTTPLKMWTLSSDTSAFVSDSVFNSNSRFLDVIKSNLTVTSTIFRQNVITANSDFVGLIRIKMNASVLLTNCSFSNNSVSKRGYQGGLISLWSHGSLHAENTEFLGNRGGKQSGVIGTGLNGGLVHLVNCVFEENDSVDGAAIVVTSQLSTVGCSFKGNQASGRGGAIVVAGGGQYTDTGSEFHSNKAGTKGKV